MRVDAVLLALIAACPAAAQDAPQSAIPWLSDSLAAPRTQPRADEPAATPLTGSEITVMALGQTRRDAVGLLAPSLTGLPPDTFAGSDPARAAELFAQQPGNAIPAMQDLVMMLMLAELDGPALIVCHRGVMRALLARATGWDYRGPEPFRIKRAAVHPVTMTEGRPSGAEKPEKLVPR